MNAAFKVPRSFEIMRFKRCHEEVRVIFRLAVEKMGCCDKVEQKAEAEEIAQICPVLALSGILTPDILCVDECFPAPGTLEIEEIGRRTKSMKPTDNEIWLAFYKDEIRPASHLRADYQPLRIFMRSAEADVSVLSPPYIQTKQIGYWSYY